jgi:hypothetical protein
LTIQQFVNLSDDRAFRVFDLYLKLRLYFWLRVCRGPDFRDLFFRQMKRSLHQAFTGLPEADGRGLVPDNVILAQNIREHEHIKRIAHGIERSAKVSAKIIAIVKTQRHLHFNIAKII